MPSIPASCALYPDEPSSATVGDDDASGVARNLVHMPESPRRSPSRPITSITFRGNCSTLWCGSRPKAAAVAGSVPGARPMPRSIRPGCNASSNANCSAIANGAWLGSITPPDPTLMRSVRAARWAIRTAGEVLATVAMLWCSATQNRVMPSRSAACASVTVWASACDESPPSRTTERSRTDNATMPAR